MEQRTEEWFAARLGKVTASRIADVLATTKSGPAASRANYLAELVAERLTGKVYEHFTNATMQWGTEQEPYARDAYERKYDLFIIEVGFVPHPTIEMAGASPDGLVGEDGLVEIKCPNTATHIKILTGGKIERKYFSQMQWQMDCTGRQWCDFVSYDPRLPERLSLHVRRVERDEPWLEETRAAVAVFLAEVADTVEQLEAL